MENLRSGNTLRLLRPDEIPHILEEGELGAVLEWAVTRPDGKVIEHRVKKSESFVQQFLQLLFVMFTHATLDKPLSIRDTANTLRNVFCYAGGVSSPFTSLFNVLAGATATTFGTLVGTGNVAPTISDYAMGTLIAHGVGAGAMQYGAVTFGAPGSDATTSQLTVIRAFTANAGGITVNEIGLVATAYYTSVLGNFLIIRDVIGGGIAVGAGNVLTVNYRLQATV